MLRRLQKMICALTIALLLVSLLPPALATKTAAYISKGTTVYKSASTRSAHKSVSSKTKVYVTGSTQQEKVQQLEVPGGQDELVQRRQ